jgi:hypothetical protein
MKPPTRQVSTNIYVIPDLAGDAPITLATDEHTKPSQRNEELEAGNTDETATEIEVSILQMEEGKRDKNSDLLGGKVEPPPRGKSQSTLKSTVQTGMLTRNL